MALAILRSPCVTLWVPCALPRITLAIPRIALVIILRTTGVAVRIGRRMPRAPGAIRGIARPIRRSPGPVVMAPPRR